MSLAYACDRAGCDTWHRAEHIRAGWLTVVERHEDRDRDFQFCSVDCLLLHFGARSPGQEIAGHPLG
jgi:hypothetical protein